MRIQQPCLWGIDHLTTAPREPLWAAINFAFPQGRNVTQYQFVDDFSLTLGTKHTLKLGENFHRYDIGDHDFGNRAIGLLIPLDISSFYTGGTRGTQLQQNFATSSDVPVGIYGIGFYVQDEWRATQSLKVTLDLRMDHNSNPVCQTDCFARLATDFADLNHSAAIPYNQAIVTGQHGGQALVHHDYVAATPRYCLDTVRIEEYGGPRRHRAVRGYIPRAGF